MPAVQACCCPHTQLKGNGRRECLQGRMLWGVSRHASMQACKHAWGMYRGMHALQPELQGMLVSFRAQWGKPHGRIHERGGGGGPSRNPCQQPVGQPAVGCRWVPPLWTGSDAHERARERTEVSKPPLATGTQNLRRSCCTTHALMPHPNSTSEVATCTGATQRPLTAPTAQQPEWPATHQVFSLPQAAPSCTCSCRDMQKCRGCHIESRQGAQGFMPLCCMTQPKGHCEAVHMQESPPFMRWPIPGK